MNKYKLLFTFFLSYCFSQAYSQDSTVVRDFETWNGITLSKSFLDKKLDLKLTEEFRFSDNSLSLNNFFTEFQAEYEFIKNFEFGLGYRFIRDQKKNGSVSENRFYTNLNYKHSFDRFTLYYRFQFQNQKEMSDAADAVNKMRLRFKVKYNIKNWKFDPYFGAESFYSMETNRIEYITGIYEVNKVSGFEKMRYTIGTDYEFNKHFALGAFYRLESEMASYPMFYGSPGRYHIVGVNLGIKLK